MELNFKDIGESYIIESQIGKGAFSVVNKITCKTTGLSYACKTILKEKLSSDASSQIQREIQALRRCQHLNVIKLLEVFESDTSLYLIMELMERDLFEEVVKNGSISEPRARSYFYQIAEGIKHLHSLCVTHRDLKLENCLLTDGGIILKISDLGLSKVLKLSDTEMMKTRCGSPNYAAPEILNGEGYTPSVDIWSMGVILYAMIYGEFPYQASPSSPYSCYEMILRGDLRFPREKNSCHHLRDLIERLLCVDVSNRVTLDEVYAHPWMRKIVSYKLGRTNSDHADEKSVVSDRKTFTPIQKKIKSVCLEHVSSS